MSERSIAEIIGWRRVLTYNNNSHVATHDTHPPQIGPTPDDMLTWLRGRGYSMNANCTPTYDFALQIAREGEGETFYNETLHAALESAVRAVDKATP